MSGCGGDGGGARKKERERENKVLRIIRGGGAKGDFL